MTEELLVGVASVLVLGIAAQWIAWRLKLPSILVLLTFGFIAGPITGFLHVDDLLGDLLFPLVSLSVGIILFEGGLSLKFSDIRTSGRVIRNLISVGALVTWVLSSAAAYFILNLNLALSVQLGAVLVVTGPTVIGPLLRHVRPTGQVNSILRWEGILIDPVGATLAVLVFDAILIGDVQQALGPTVQAIILTILVGGAIGFLGGQTLVFLLKHYLIPDYLQNVIALMGAVAVFAVSELIQHESGLLATTVMGIVVANQRAVPVKRIIEFKETVGVLLISSLFILLSARLEISDLTNLGLGTVLFLVVLMFIVRPASVFISSFGSSLSWKEKIFLSWMAPRGIVAASVSSIFALRLAAVNHPQAELLVPLTFSVIVVTCAVYGLTALPLARWLGLSQASPQGVLIVGAHTWAREIAAALQKAGFKTVLVDTNFSNVQQAKLQGLNAVYGSATADELEDLNLDGIGRVLAMTSNNEVNSLAAIHFMEDFGRAEVYQLPLAREEKAQNDEVVSRDLRGRILFSPSADFVTLQRRFAEGAAIKATPLTREFDYRAYRAMHGDNVLPLFVSDRTTGRLHIFATDNPPSPQPGQTIISLIANPPAELQPTEVELMEA